MYDVEVIERSKPVEAAEPEVPKELRMTLSVCGCFSYERLTFITAKAERVTSILGISMKDLECAAVTAMFTGKPQVVACYKQRDIAETKLAQLEAETPFIARSCHSFDLIDER